MSKSTQKKWDSYKDYLNSKEWKNLKDEFYEEKDCMHCEICNVLDQKIQYNAHHWRYSKNWADDNTSNLVNLCRDCHAEQHDMHPKEYWSGNTWENKYHYLHEQNLLKIEDWNGDRDLVESISHSYRDALLSILSQNQINFYKRYKMNKDGTSLQSTQYVNGIKMHPLCHLKKYLIDIAKTNKEVEK